MAHSTCPHCGHRLDDEPQQLDLASLSAPASPKARRGDPGTSHDAAKLAFPNQGNQRYRILLAVGRVPGGLTAEQIAGRTGLKYVSVSTRVTELKRGGWLVVIRQRDGKDVLGLTEPAAERLPADWPPTGVAA